MATSVPVADAAAHAPSAAPLALRVHRAAAQDAVEIPVAQQSEATSTTTEDNAQVGSMTGTQGSAASGHVDDDDEDTSGGLRSPGGPQSSGNSAANGNNNNAGSARRPSQAERNYYMFVEPEDQLASIFQLCVHNTMHVAILIALTVGACVATTAAALVVFRDKLSGQSYTVIAIFMVLSLQMVVLWRWITLVRIKYYAYEPSEESLKSLGLLRALSVWVWVMSAMVAGGGSGLDRVFLAIFLIHFVCVDFFFVLARTVLIVGFLVIMPVYLPVAACRRRSATKRALRRIPVLRFSQTKFSREDYNLDCPICLTDFEEGEPLRKLRCRHFFHKACIDKWLAHKSTCPVCRSDIKSAVDVHATTGAETGMELQEQQQQQQQQEQVAALRRAENSTGVVLVVDEETVQPRGAPVTTVTTV